VGADEAAKLVEELLFLVKPTRSAASSGTQYGDHIKEFAGWPGPADSAGPPNGSGETLVAESQRC